MIKGLLGLALSAVLAFTGFEAWDYYVSVDHPEALCFIIKFISKKKY